MPFSEKTNFQTFFWQISNF